MSTPAAGPPRMTAQREALLRGYGACEITWRELQHRGLDEYIQVPAGLGELGPRLPIAPGSPNQAARADASAVLRRALQGVQEGQADTGPNGKIMLHADRRMRML